MKVARPTACPAEGVSPQFDAGWNAHEVGLGRETVQVLTGASSMALLGWDCRAAVVNEAAGRCWCGKDPEPGCWKCEGKPESRRPGDDAR